MRVICIDDSDQIGKGPFVKQGNIYTVMEQRFCKAWANKYSEGPSGNYYTLVECGNKYEYHSSLFITINEDQADETTFERNYKSETV
jgi:hypothetical protein